MIKWNRFDTDLKNELAIFTCCISFTGPFVADSKILKLVRDNSNVTVDLDSFSDNFGILFRLWIPGYNLVHE